MGIAILSSLIGLGAAAIQAHGAKSAAASSAAAQSDINEATMAFNEREAAKARDWSASQADIERQFNAEQSEIQRQYAERLSTTAHQREVEDLRLAGLNPILSASGGNGSSTPVLSNAGSVGVPASSAASVNSLKAVMKPNILGAFVSSAMEGMRLNNDMKRAEAEDLKANADWKNAQTKEKEQKANENYINQQIKTLKADERWKDWQSKTEEQKVGLVKEQIITEIKRQNNEARITDAEVGKAGAIAYQAVKMADTDEAYKGILGKMSQEHDKNEKWKLRQEAEKLQQDYYRGKKQLEKEFYETGLGRAVYTVDRIISAVSPIKLNFKD